MKRQLLFAGLFFGIFFSMHAKSWEMTYKTHGLIADDVNNMKLTAYMNPGEGGYNQVWDYSELKITRDFEGLIEKSVFSKNFNEVLNTNVVLKEFNNQFYFKGDDNSLELYGVAINDKIIMKYNKPFVKMKYPFGYGDSFSGTYNGDYYSGDLKGVIDGIYSVEADGYGSLLLPNNVRIDDVLRVKTIRTYDQVFQGRSQNISVITYRWYAKNERFPLLVLIESRYLNNDKTNSSYQAAYRADLDLLFIATGMNDNADINSFNVFPNPFHSIATIQYSLVNDGQVVIDLYSINGDKLKTITDEMKPAGNYQIEISSSVLMIPAGTYYFKVQIGNEVSTKKIIVQ
ncbi:MAG: T9SS type A sorting domain-containing protein [Bacteroidales bacterium]|nr:T9SS type A sorting domain-containing protein [Bacteroidales bacterium]